MKRFKHHTYNWLIVAAIVVLIAIAGVVAIKKAHKTHLPECIAGGAGGIANEPCYSPPGALYF